jgi:hypothetical protein
MPEMEKYEVGKMTHAIGYFHEYFLKTFTPLSGVLKFLILQNSASVAGLPVQSLLL